MIICAYTSYKPSRVCRVFRKLTATQYSKTQIAIEYCYRHLKKLTNGQILWMHASSASKVMQSCRTIGQILRLPGWNDPQSDILRVYQSWLEDACNDRFLLVVDKLDDLDLIEEPLPSENGPRALYHILSQKIAGSVLITTRDRRVGERLALRNRTVSVPAILATEAKQLLQSVLDPGIDFETDKIDHLIAALDYLPLAVTQTAAYLTENWISIQDYLLMLDDDNDELQNLLTESLSDGRREHPGSNSVMKTWKLSFNQIKKQDVRAAELLSLMAMFDRQKVPTNLLQREGEPKRQLLGSLATLQNFSLVVCAQSTGRSYSMHRLVQVAVRAWMNIENVLSDRHQEAQSILADKFPSGESETWVLCETYMPRTRIILAHVEVGELQSQTTSALIDRDVTRAKLLVKIGWFDKKQGRIDIAKAEAEEAFQIFSRAEGPESMRALSCRITIANCMTDVWQPREAIALLQEIVDAVKCKHYSRCFLGKSVYPLSSTLVLSSATNHNRHILTSTLAPAQPHNAFGPRHRETLRYMGNQAWAYNRLGSLDKANQEFFQTMQINEAEFGPLDAESTISKSDFACNLACYNDEEKKRQS